MIKEIVLTILSQYCSCSYSIATESSIRSQRIIHNVITFDESVDGKQIERSIQKGRETSSDGKPRRVLHQQWIVCFAKPEESVPYNLWRPGYIFDIGGSYASNWTYKYQNAIDIDQDYIRSISPN
jgi:hypothetical protein